jgi:O-antigen/teichoic acid export membrane protein
LSYENSLDFFSISKISYQSAVSIVFILSFYALFCCITTYLTALYRTHLLNHRSLLIVNCIRLLELALTFSLVYAYKDPVYAALALLISRALGSLYFCYDIWRRLPNVSLSLNYFRISFIRTGFARSIYYFIFPLTNLLQNQGVLLAISAVTNPSFVALYSALRTMAKSVTQIVNSINSATWQEYSWLAAQGEIPKIKSLLTKSIAYSFLVSLFFTFVFIFFGDLILKMWSNGKLRDDEGLLFIISIGVLFNSLWISVANFMRATNNHGYINYVYLSVTVSVILVYLSYPYNSMPFLMYVYAFSEFVMFFVLFYMLKKFFNLAR